MDEEIRELGCPECDSTDFDISALVWVHPFLNSNGGLETESVDESHEWHDDSVAVCNECGHEGRAHEFIRWVVADASDTSDDDEDDDDD